MLLHISYWSGLLWLGLDSVLYQLWIINTAVYPKLIRSLDSDLNQFKIMYAALSPPQAITYSIICLHLDLKIQTWISIWIILLHISYWSGLTWLGLDSVLNQLWIIHTSVYPKLIRTERHGLYSDLNHMANIEDWEFSPLWENCVR